MKYIVKKTCTLIITLFIVSLLAFLAFQIIPGDPTTDLLGTEATEEAKQALRQELGLDRPVLVRYFDKDRIRDYNRITIGTREQMDILLEKVRELLQV